MARETGAWEGLGAGRPENERGELWRKPLPLGKLPIQFAPEFPRKWARPSLWPSRLRPEVGPPKKLIAEFGEGFQEIPDCHGHLVLYNRCK